MSHSNLELKFLSQFYQWIKWIYVKPEYKAYFYGSLSETVFCCLF